MERLGPQKRLRGNFLPVISANFQKRSTASETMRFPVLLYVTMNPSKDAPIAAQQEHDNE